MKKHTGVGTTGNDRKLPSVQRSSKPTPRQSQQKWEKPHNSPHPKRPHRNHKPPYADSSSGSGKEATDVFYLAPKGKYLLPDVRNNWMPATRQDAADYLVERYGFQSGATSMDGLSPIDRELLRIRRAQSVGYANPLAGWKRGYHHDLNGRSILVTDEPKAIVPVHGRWRIIKQLITTLLADPHHDQATHFHGWVAEISKSLINGKWRPGQILALIGTSSSGKSLLQSIITVITGGREADPSLFLSRRTNFNGELFAAEHLRIDDDVVIHGKYAGRQFGNGLKQIAANRTHKFHDKRSRAVDLPVFWRCTISLNNGPDDLTVLPCMDESMADKFILLKCSPATLPMPTVTVEQETALWEALVNEVPHYVYWLLNEFALPEEYRSSRYGVNHFHHPDIIALLRGSSPEEQLLRLIDSTGEAMFAEGGKPWTGTAAELRAILLQLLSPLKQEAKNALIKCQTLGECLQRLAARFPLRVKEARNTRQDQSWILFPAWQSPRTEKE